MRDHKPTVIETFNGLWKRGESTPIDHFEDCNNIAFEDGGFGTRPGVDTFLPYANVIRQYTFNRVDSEGLLILDAAGNIYHSKSPTPFTPILSIPLMKDFSFVPIANRAYITPSDGVSGLEGEFVYVYDGLGNPARKTGGNPPEMMSNPTVGIPKPFTVFNSELDSGTTAITKGVHIFAIFNVAADLSNSKLGPEVFAILDAPGGKQATLSNIPINLTNLLITKRGVASTKALENTFDVNAAWPLDLSTLQFFFAGYINDTTTTSLTGAIRDEDLTIDISALLGAGSGSTALPAPVTNAFYAYPGELGGQQDLGFKLISVIYETDTGYLTAPGPQFYAPVVALRNDIYIDLINIPVSTDPHVLFKRIASTKVIENYNGDQTGYEFYFVPETRIANSITTLRISFFDADLLDDASHLLDNFSSIPASLGLGTYHNRLLSWNEHDNISLIRVSAPGEPEAISQVDGLIVTETNGRIVTRCQEFRDNLYVFKHTRVIAYNDNGDVPSTWPAVSLEEGIGTTPHGIAEVLDSGGIDIDYLIVGGYHGIALFNGSFARPELTYKIRDYWNSFSKDDLVAIQILNDTISQIIYICLPDGTILIGDYSEGFNPKAIKWSTWTFDFKPTTISLVNKNELAIGAFFKNVITINNYIYSGMLNMKLGFASVYGKGIVNIKNYIGDITFNLGFSSSYFYRPVSIYSFTGLINMNFGLSSIITRTQGRVFVGNIAMTFGTSTDLPPGYYFRSANNPTYIGNIPMTLGVSGIYTHTRKYTYVGSI